MTRSGYRLLDLGNIDSCIDPCVSIRGSVRLVPWISTSVPCGAARVCANVPMSEPSGVSLSLSGVRILLVEDSWPAGVALRRLLQVLGAEVSGPVATAADALRLASERPPDAALIDFSLRDGELAGDLIERLHEQGIHIVITTGYTDLPAKLRHAVAILHKPFNDAELFASLRPVVSRKAEP